MAYIVAPRRDACKGPSCNTKSPSILSAEQLYLDACRSWMLQSPLHSFAFMPSQNETFRFLVSWSPEYLENLSTWLGNLATFRDGLAEGQEYCLSLPSSTEQYSIWFSVFLPLHQVLAKFHIISKYIKTYTLKISFECGFVKIRITQKTLVVRVYVVYNEDNFSFHEITWTQN